MMTIIAIMLLFIFAGLMVMMASTPMMAESESRSPSVDRRAAKLERSVAVPSQWDNHQQAA